MLNGKPIVPGNAEQTLLYAANHFVTTCQESIHDHDAFYVALSGGSTPKAIYELITATPLSTEIDWNKIHLFWSDERACPPSHPDSNYGTAMTAGLGKMLIPPQHIHRMVAEENIEKNAENYEKKIHHVLRGSPFDLIMLGVGEDGHTASLFPGTKALHDENKLILANYIPQKQCWRMTFTFECINSARHTVIYALGRQKREVIKRVFTAPPNPDLLLPCQRVGTAEKPALWILDQEAAGDSLI